MSESFDPYYTWLGIPPAQQPPHHYRLLGIEAFENNPDVIQRAADRCMADLRTYQTGKHNADSQRLLNEVAAAKICLLDPKKKAAYDATLREKQAAENNEAVEANVFASLIETAATSSSTPARSPAKSKPSPALIGGGAAVLALVLIAAWMFLSNILLSSKDPSDEPKSVARTDAAPKPATAPSPPPAPPDSDSKKAEAPGAVGQAASLPVAANAPEKTGAPSPPKTDAPPATSPPPNPPAAAAPPPANDPSPKPTEEVKKHSIPSAETQREIGATIEETYKTSEAKTPEAKVQLAKELSAAAGKSAKPEEQYVLLRKAIDLACDGGDAALMLETIGPMTEAFAIDPLAAKAAMLDRFAKGPRSPARVQSLAEGSRGVIEEAIAEDRYEIASNLARTVADACSRSTPPLRKEAADRRKRVGQLQKLFEEVQKALETLKATPEDAEANLAAGTWYAFVKDDWKTGLPYLAKGSDPVLKSLAGREVSSPPATPEDQLKLADAWWDAAAERRGEQQAAMLRTAGHWYEQAIGQLQGINKTKAEKRLSQIAELTQDTSIHPGREPPPAIAPFDAKRARAYQLQWARYLKVPVEFANSIGMRFVLIPPGEFDMGSTQQEVDRLAQEAKKLNSPGFYIDCLASGAPQHRVKISRAFYLACCEVTQGQYEKVMAVNPSAVKNNGPDGPVEQISWDMAAAFCRRLSELPADKIGKSEYRLPTEAEWEYTARAGTRTDYFFGSDPSALSEYAWYAANSGARPHPVAQKNPNAFGLYDVLGNVAEWCGDVFAPEYYKQSPVADPPGPPTGPQRAQRGGIFNTPDVFLRCAIRYRESPGYRDLGCGFRVARVFSSQMTSPMATKRPAGAGGSRSSAGSRGSAPSPAVAPFSAEQARKHQEQWAKHLKVRIEQTNSIGMRFVLIPPGEFMMGSPESDPDAAKDEKPQHRVRITKPYWMGTCEVTVGQFGRFVEDSGYQTDMENRGIKAIWRNAIPGQTNDHPAVALSWNDAAAFAQWLSKKEGQPYRLSTEGEWEFACRAGSQTRYCFGDDAKELAQYDWIAENADGGTHPVGRKKSNAWGLFDMHGSVLEWCSDWYGLYSEASSDDPAGPNDGSFRVLCGGCWTDKPAKARSARRGGGGPATAGNNVGFRLARAITP